LRSWRRRRKKKAGSQFPGKEGSSSHKLIRRLSNRGKTTEGLRFSTKKKKGREKSPLSVSTDCHQGRERYPIRLPSLERKDPRSCKRGEIFGASCSVKKGGKREGRGRIAITSMRRGGREEKFSFPRPLETWVVVRKEGRIK